MITMEEVNKVYEMCNIKDKEKTKEEINGRIKNIKDFNLPNELFSTFQATFNTNKTVK